MSSKDKHLEDELQALLVKGVQAHQAGRLEEAEIAYRRILDSHPDHADANHLLGTIAHQVGDHLSAIQLIAKAIQANPRAAPFHNNKGNAEKALGKLEDAVASYQKAITLKPDDDEALSNLGLTLAELGRFEEAVNSFEASLRINPGLFGLHVKLGLVLKDMGRLDEAIGHFRQAVTAHPEDAAIHAVLGNTLHENKLLDDAAASFQKALAIDPDDAETLGDLGTTLLKMGRFEDAAANFQKALAINSDNAEVHNNLGIALNKLDCPEDAEASYREALALDPDYAGALNNLGSLLQGQGNPDEAIDYYNKAIAIVPDYAEAYSSLGSALEVIDRLEDAENACRRALQLESDHRQAHLNLSMVLMRRGNLKEGWEQYEWRQSLERAAAEFPQPAWDGSDLNAKRIILWGEQGLGDETRFASIIPDVLETGCAVSIECDERFVDIFARSFAGATVHARPYSGAATDPGQFDYQCPFAGLARFFRPDQKSFPTGRPGYLKADPELVKFWKKRLSDLSDRPKVGLSWNSALMIPLRIPIYASIEDLAPILTIDGVDFINLQSHECRQDIAEAKERYGVDIHAWDDIDLRNDLNGVVALTSCLDLVISFPTFSSEFAGALDVPTVCFVNHKENLDQLGTDDAIWYPQTHYVSKTRAEPWQGVLEEIAKIARTKLDL